ncbi:hypothetical protein CN934_08440 [Ensifer sp. MMN_5]|nr:hypothetical protein CN934_08440 [Ensifer sp. MMN_5]PND29274.1 hypothetical protein CN933_04285 [Sinorhizobium sp. M4_45]
MRDRGCAATTSKRNGTLYTGVTRDLSCRLAIFTVYETRRGTAPSLPSSLCSSQGSSSAASAARESSFSPRTWSGWIPVTSTGMRVSNKPRRP